jgi:alpha-galactosidase/6-phospho-beta-glucosidase family protein
MSSAAVQEGRSMSIKIAVIGAGSECFDPGTIRDVYLSDVLNGTGVELVLMDIVSERLIRGTRAPVRGEDD